MTASAKAFLKKLEEHNVQYQTNVLASGSCLIKTSFRCDNVAALTVHFAFDLDDDNVAVKVYSIAKIPEDKYSIMTDACSEINRDYRWVSFYLDSDLELTAQIDAVITVETAAQVSYDLMYRMVNIVDEVYPRFMHVLWG